MCSSVWFLFSLFAVSPCYFLIIIAGCVQQCPENPKVRGKEFAVEIDVPMLLPREFLRELFKAGELQAGMSSKVLQKVSELCL